MAAPNQDHLDDEKFTVTAQALDAAIDHPTTSDPKHHLHMPALASRATSLLQTYFPQTYLEQVEASYHMGNYVIDRRTGSKSFEEMSIYVRLGMHLLYYGSNQEKVLHWQKTLALLKQKSEDMGKKYDDPASREHILPFIESFNLQAGLEDLKEPDPSKYGTFNEFFAREIKESARPIDEPENSSVVSSPADCRLTAFPTIDLATKYWIKGFGFTLEKLLGDASLAQQFDGGSLVIARLAPQDYHRWHSPINGTVQSIKDIPGAYYTVNPQAINEPGTMDVYCENKRSVMLLTRAETGSPVIVIAVGAMLVGGIKYQEGVGQPGAQVRRGQCLGAFYYGGSTVLVLYPRGEITLDTDLVANSTEQNCETLMRVGWRCGAGPA